MKILIDRNNYIFPAILAIVVGGMYWLVFAYVLNKSPEINEIFKNVGINEGNNFTKHIDVYITVGLGFPALAIFSIVMNMMYKDDGNGYAAIGNIIVTVGYWLIIIAMVICLILMVAGLLNMPRKSIFDI